MSEHEVARDIPRRSPTLVRKIGAITYSMTWYNTTICEFTGAYEDVQHVEVQDGQPPTRLYGENELMQDLRELRFPVHIRPEPTHDQVAYYTYWQDKRMRREL